MELSRYAELFLSESREHVSAINQRLLALEATPEDTDAVDAVYRSVHTIKGMAATMGYADLSALAHAMEDLLDDLRGRGRPAADPELIDLLLRATDAIEAGCEAAVAGERPEAHDAIIETLREAIARPAEGDDRGSEPAPRTEPAGEGLVVGVTMDPETPLPGVRAFMAVRRLHELGEVLDLEPSEEALQGPDFDGTFRARLRTHLGAAEVTDAVRAVGDVAEVVVLDADAEEPTAPPAKPAAPRGGGATTAAPRRARHVRIDLQRLDALMNQVGELVILRDQLRSLAAEREDPELSGAIERATRLIGDLQFEVIGARMVPVWQVFDRFPRLVRDAARAVGREVELRVEGREIELDRAMLEQIGDPLVHLLRNAVDHGIEPPAERETAGKPPRGLLRLTATRERSRVVIRVQDDGRGIDAEAVRRAAVSRGLVTPEAAAELGPEQVHRLLLRPGFSTAKRVTDVSGRGVGLDAVASSVRALGGVLEIASAPGLGATFTIRLPLTLAIVQALLVRARGETYALPLAHVRETVEITGAEVARAGGQEVIEVRDELIPCFSLERALHGEAAAPVPEALPAVIVEVGERRRAVFVDSLEGQREVVVKDFASTRGTPAIFSGATVLADGRPALILDAGSLLAAEEDGESAAEPVAGS
jgi:two-component system, chemotaxis family, sensor kinase CheA